MELPLTWQDWVLTIGQILFFVALLPSIFSQHKPSAWTSFMTGGTLTAFTVVFFSLGLIWGAVTAALVAVAWYVLLLQKLLAKD